MRILSFCWVRLSIHCKGDRTSIKISLDLKSIIIGAVKYFLIILTLCITEEEIMIQNSAYAVFVYSSVFNFNVWWQNHY
jgi:hypothetical protein